MLIKFKIKNITIAYLMTADGSVVLMIEESIIIKNRYLLYLPVDGGADGMSGKNTRGNKN